jgi:hypothetical protein
MILGTSSAFPRNPVGFVGFYASSRSRQSRTSARFFTYHYPEIYDSSVIIFHATGYIGYSWITNQPRFTGYINAIYYTLLGHDPDSGYQTPWGCFNGILELAVYDTTPPPPLWDTLNASFGKTSPLLVKLEGTTDDSIFIKVTSDNTVGADPFYLHAFILENHMNLSGSPTDGYSHIGRDVFPSSYGYKFTIAPDTTIDIHLSYERIHTWDQVELELAITITDSTNSEIIQACHGALPAANYFYAMILPGYRSLLAKPGEEITFYLNLYNIGLNLDTLDLSIDFDAITGWTVDICHGDSCFEDHSKIIMDAMTDTVFRIKVKTDPDTLGIMNIDLIANSLIGGRERLGAFTVGTGGEILYVEDGSYSWYYTQSFNNLGYENSFLRHPRSYLYMEPEQLDRFQTVIWGTGSSSSGTLLESDKYAIKNYLRTGGHFWLTGGRIGRNLVYYTSYPDTLFFQKVLKAGTHSDELYQIEGYHSVRGVFDEITLGLTLNLFGGDGANNAWRCEVLTPARGWGAHPIFYYVPDSTEPLTCAALCYQEDGTAYGRLVYFAFPFEAIDNQEDRDTVMARILYWLRTGSGITESEIVVPERISLDIAPNPFNSVCEISYSMIGTGSLQILDLTGKVVENVIISGIGKFRWNALNMPSGIYLVSLSSEKRTLTKKITLLQ